MSEWSRGRCQQEDDGRFATLGDVVEHYNGFFKSVLVAQEKNDLVEYLKSL